MNAARPPGGTRTSDHQGSTPARRHRSPWLALLLAPALHAQIPEAQRRSDFELMRPAVQAMQRDDTRNPAMLWVQQGEQLWRQAGGAGNTSCAACHGDASTSMRGVAVRYPAFDVQTQGPINLAQRINRCRQSQQQATPWKPESDELLALESFIALQSRGLPIAVPDDARLQPALERGRLRYQQRLGQLDLSCAQCHDQRWGLRLGGTTIPQGHPTSYPQYRLEWQGMGSLQRRLRNCLSGVRAQPWPLGATELVELEIFLRYRASGLPLETPGVRP